MTVYIVMQSTKHTDNPIGVFKSYDAANNHIKSMVADPANKHLTYWVACNCTLQD